ncbi:MAG: membrane protein insertion efficiency factor YidD [Vicinamibacterales bacterium]
MAAQRLLIAIAILAVVAVVFAERLALAGIDGYQRALAPLVERAGVTCRFVPSCSHYAEIVIARDGIVRGGWRAVRRIARCTPATPPGTVDEP